jgi:hypothetical protein
MSKNEEDRPYGANRSAWHQQNSKSDPRDSHGRLSKASQQVDQNTKPVAAKPYERDSSKDEKAFDPREPKPKGSYDCGGATRSSVKGGSTRDNKHTKY